MSSSQLHNYLRMHRKKVGLTQKELAFLLGCNHTGKISHYERFNQIPHLTTVIAYEIIFQTHTRHLFGGLFEKIEMETRKRAEQLLNQKIKYLTSQRNQLKLNHLKQLIKSENIVTQ